MKIGDKIKERRTKLNLSQDELAKKMGYKSRSSINKIELGLTDISQTKIKEFADALNTTVSYFFDITDNVSDSIKPKRTGFKIPVLGKVIAGVPIEAIEEIIDYEEIDEQLARTGEFFALQVKGDSMEPRMVEGDVVIVRKQSQVDSGDVAIVLVNGDEATVKRVRILDNGLMLIPFNSKYVPWTYTAEECESLPVCIIGKVVELRGKF